MTQSILEQIIDYKKREQAEASDNFDFEQPQCKLPSRSFARAIASPKAARHGKPFCVIAEIKFASPSAGTIRQRQPDDVATIAREYEKAGASVLSVLTDEHWFEGSLDNLELAKAACNLPILRKDFIVSERQVYESHSYGADAILLIASILTDSELRQFALTAYQCNLDVLIEVHDEQELDRVLAIEALQKATIGINNRDLATLEIDLSTSLTLKAKLPTPRTVVAESGISQAEDLDRLQQARINHILIGQSLMRNDNPGLALAQLLA